MKERHLDKFEQPVAQPAAKQRPSLLVGLVLGVYLFFV